MFLTAFCESDGHMRNFKPTFPMFHFNENPDDLIIYQPDSWRLGLLKFYGRILSKNTSIIK